MRVDAEQCAPDEEGFAQKPPRSHANFGGQRAGRAAVAIGDYILRIQSVAAAMKREAGQVEALADEDHRAPRALARLKGAGVGAAFGLGIALDGLGGDALGKEIAVHDLSRGSGVGHDQSGCGPAVVERNSCVQAFLVQRGDCARPHDGAKDEGGVSWGGLGGRHHGRA